MAHEGDWLIANVLFSLSPNGSGEAQPHEPHFGSGGGLSGAVAENTRGTGLW